MPGTPDRMDFYQAKNTLTTFAKESGGIYIPITFPGEIPNALQSINALLRNQYSLGFVPVKDGKQHKADHGQLFRSLKAPKGCASRNLSFMS